MFLGGYHSEMTGTKGEWLADYCRRTGRAYLRLDYSGHGLSGGDFADGTIGGWCRDALTVMERRVSGPCILVGSSMGGWIMLLVARELGDRVRGMVGIAAAPDFTRDLMWNAFDSSTRQRLETEGIVYLESDYDDTKIPVRREFIEDGNRHLLLDAPIPIRCPVHLLHGRKDPDVPWQTAERLMEGLESEAVTVSYFKDGDHRLSEPRYLEFLGRALDAMVDGCVNGG
ncbi:MAG: alpha/beta hydrolase [Proteobacteria bacterium]|nr:MAG: alpha/beta hydrolase [Pseudomonadota bacterium]